MKSPKTAIIIGAGIAGISSSILLSKRGYKVQIFEKNSYPGGRCGQILKDGHRFDIGATILMMPSIYRSVFNALEMDFDKSIDLRRLDHVYKLYFGDGKTLSFTTDHDAMRAQLEAFEPGSSANFNKYITAGYSFFQLSMRDLLGRNFKNLFQFITFRNVILLIKLKIHLNHTRFVKRFFKNQDLRQAFTFQNIYVGQNPLASPALFAMLPAAELTEGALFPIGGMYSITEKLLSKARELGVEFQYGKTATKINTSNKRVEEVIFADGSIAKADVIIANVDLPYVYKELLPDTKKSRRIEKKDYACSAMVFHWGLKKTFPQLEHHSVFLSKDQKGSLDKIFSEYSVSANPSFYVHSPVRTDKSAAPKGEDSISVIVPMGHLKDNIKHNWGNLIKQTRAGVLSRLKEEGMGDIEENIKFEISYPPSTWESIFNVTNGSVFGSLKHSILQMGYFRPHNRHDKYHNLYFVGGSTHPGNGVPLVLLSSKLTTERILQEQNIEN